MKSDLNFRLQKKKRGDVEKRVNELYKIIFTKIDAHCNESYNCGEDSGRGSQVGGGCDLGVKNKS